jgi:hypothetical protein
MCVVKSRLFGKNRIFLFDDAVTYGLRISYVFSVPQIQNPGAAHAMKWIHYQSDRGEL